MKTQISEELAAQTIVAFERVPRPGPVLVCDGGRVVGRAVVIVSPKDPNWWKGPQAVERDGVVEVG
jgi:hypothetical protein